MNHRSIYIALALSAGGTSCTRTNTPAPANPGITRVVLFQNGIAYYERRSVTTDSSLELRARRDQLDDILKSLTVVDSSGAHVSSVRVLAAAPADNAVTVRVGLTAASRHDLRVSYMTEASGWRPTYRLVAATNGTVRVQGFAVVDNAMAEPWRDVELALSTDVPLSFRYALREPRAAHRPRFDNDGRLLVEPAADPLQTAPVANNTALANVQGAYAQQERFHLESSNRAGQQVGVRRQDTAAAVNQGAPAQAAPGAQAASAAVDPQRAMEQAEAERGFTVENPGRVTLGVGEVAMVPFADTAVPGDVVLLYKPAPGCELSQSRPYRAVLFRNPLDAPMLTGPVAVYAGGQFLGDGVTAAIPARASAFVAFALEPSVRVATTTETTQDEVRAVALHAGELRVDLRSVVRTRFRVTASAPWHERIYLFAPAVDGYTPRRLPDGTVVTPSGYFVPAAAGGLVAEATLELVRRTNERVNIAADPSHAYVQPMLAMLDRARDGGETATRVRAITARTAVLHEQRTRIDEDLVVQRDALETHRSAVAALRNVPANGALRARLTQSFAQAVTRVDGLTRQVAEGSAEELALRQEWYARLRALTLEAPPIAEITAATPPPPAG